MCLCGQREDVSSQKKLVSKVTKTDACSGHSFLTFVFDSLSEVQNYINLNRKEGVKEIRCASLFFFFITFSFLWVHSLCAAQEQKT